MKLALVGYGALGRYMEDMISEAFPVDASQTVYFDDGMHKDGNPKARVFSTYASDEFAEHHFFISLGYKHLRLKQKIIHRLVELGRTVPSYVHHSSYVHPTVKIGHGSMVYPGCSVDRNTVIGNGVWLANADVVAHDCQIGDCCWFGASVTLSGEVEVGECTFIGSGSVTANEISIGSDSIIGMGTSVTKSVANNVSVIGNPMKILERPIKLT